MSIFYQSLENIKEASHKQIILQAEVMKQHSNNSEQSPKMVIDGTTIVTVGLLLSFAYAISKRFG